MYSDKNYCYCHNRVIATNNILKDKKGFYTIRDNRVKVKVGKKIKFRNINERIRLTNYQIKQMKPYAD